MIVHIGQKTTRRESDARREQNGQNERTRNVQREELFHRVSTGRRTSDCLLTTG